jgi:MFS family permease
LTAAEWQDLLKFCDRSQLTLILAERCGHLFPPNIQEQLGQRAASHRVRVEKLRTGFLEIDHALRNAGIPYAVLKGFTHCPDFISDVNSRVQYDLDIYCPGGTHVDAFDTLRELGYTPIHGMDDFPIDHLPTLIRKTGWEWRNDYFDPELPLSVEIHFRLWDPSTERLNPDGLEEFWERRVARIYGGIAYTALDLADSVGYASLHLLRHVLRGDMRPFHLYELASFLHKHASRDDFWTIWRQQHSASVRQLEAICFCLASHVFACDVPDLVKSEIASLPGPVTQWFAESGDGPIASLFHPNKEELWLHMSLLQSAADRRAVFIRRVIPGRMPGPVDAVHLREDQITWRIRIRREWRYLLFFGSRVLHHLKLIIPTLAGGLRWWLNQVGISSRFLRFLAAAAVFELGMFIFFVLYNLLLLDRGFHEDFLGAVTGTMQVGAIAGTIPAGLAARQWGLKRLLMLSFLSLAIVSALRVILRDSVPLLVLAFASGAIGSCWAVCIAPAIAEMTSEKNRPLAFSIFFSTGIGLGVIGGILGGYLPAAIIGGGGSAAFAKEAALLIGCSLIGIGALLASRLELASADVRETRLYPREPMLWRFLIVLSAFHIGTGAFNPLYTAFLSSEAKLPVERIGTVFALSQFAQVVAILLAPLVIRKVGLTAAITCMLASTGLALLFLGSGVAGTLAVSVFISYMCFQYMSEPGTFSMLMSLVSPSERKGASMLNFLIANGSQAIAAFAAGIAVTRLGYRPVLEIAAGVVLLAALLFRLLMGRPASSIAPST